MGNTGRKDYSTSNYAYIKGYKWSLPSAGTYVLFCTLRTYHASNGQAKVKLDVLNHFGSSKLEGVPDKESIKYGSSIRMQEVWKDKSFGYTNHIQSWTWQVTVTGKMDIGLYGTATASRIGVQNDGNGWSNQIWWRVPQSQEGPFMKLPPTDEE